MSTLTLVTIRTLVKSELNEATATVLSDEEINSIINDGYKDVAVKCLCWEGKAENDNIAAEKILSIVATNPVRVNYVEYKTGTTEGGKGLMCILPQVVGNAPVNGNAPQYWFQWGKYIAVEPIPDAATYDLAVYYAGYPISALSIDTDLPSSLPVEFHECIYLFALAFASMKLKKWADVGNYYNQYISSVQRKKNEYIIKSSDMRSGQKTIDEVQIQEATRG
jgi:hypothetical protein